MSAVSASLDVTVEPTLILCDVSFVAFELNIAWKPYLNDSKLGDETERRPACTIGHSW